MRKQLELHGFSWSLAAVLCVLTTGIGTAGYSYYALQKERARQQVENQLSAVAELKVNEISRWLEERVADARIVIDTPLIALLVKRCFENAKETMPMQQILSWMGSFKEHYDYYSVSLLDAEGIIRLSLPDGERTDEELMHQFNVMMRTGEPLFGELERSGIVPNIHIDFLVPLSITEGEDRSPVGALLLRIDPYKFLYPLIQSWPTQSRTAESLLVRREGNEIVFLNEVRHRNNTALSLRLPLNDTKVPAAMAGQGHEGFMEGVDYRGSRVLAAIKHLPGTSWYLIAKIDEDEVYAPVRERGLLMAILVTLMIAGAGVTLGLIWSFQRSKLYKEDCDSLERRVGERTSDLQVMNERLTQEVEVRMRAEEQLRAVTTRLADTEEAERRRLARELHDRVGQNLTALNFNLSAIMNLLPVESQIEAVNRLEDSLKLVEETVKCVRNVMADLRPPLLDDYGLCAVLRWYLREFSERSGIPAVVECNGQMPRLPLSVETVLFRIAQEALSNVMRHARASRVTARIEATDRAVSMSITDDGVGFDPKAVSSPITHRSGWGMLGMRERAEMVGAHLLVDSAPGGGVRVTVKVAR